MKKKSLFVVVLGVLCIDLLATIIITETYNIPGVSSICGLILGILVPYEFNKCFELLLSKQQWKLFEHRLKRAKAPAGRGKALPAQCRILRALARY